MMKPTKEQIKQEIEKLKELAPVIRQTSMFGNDNRAQIDVQICVLETLQDDADIYNKYDHAGIDEEILESALVARQWLNGEHEVNTLSEDWEVLRQ